MLVNSFTMDVLSLMMAQPMLPLAVVISLIVNMLFTFGKLGQHRCCPASIMQTSQWPCQLWGY
jgi:hypothetical protein